MYQRKNVEWLYLYYSGESLTNIGILLNINPKAVSRRIQRMRLPTRPIHLNKKATIAWFKEPHVIALRRLFEGMMG